VLVTWNCVAVCPMLTVGAWIVVVPSEPDTAEPMLIAVVEPDSPAVPMLIALVEPDAVAPAWISVCWLTVERPIVCVPVPLAPPIVKVPEVWTEQITVLPVVWADAKRADWNVEPLRFKFPVAAMLLNVGLVALTTLPVPVSNGLFQMEMFLHQHSKRRHCYLRLKYTKLDMNQCLNLYKQ